jgi:hypothetical protein
MKKLRVAAVGITVGLGCGQAMAGGEVDSRIVDQSLPMPCNGGSAVEKDGQHGNIHGFDESYALACMPDASHASWVIRAGVSCNDPAETPKPRNSPCDNALVRALPSFNKSGDFWDQQAAPYTMRYSFIRYGIGSNCHKVDQPVRYEPKRYSPSDTTSVWLCESLSVYDGTTNASGTYEQNPRSFHPKEFVTISSKRWHQRRVTRP